jgi:signal transduction histidine kinase
MRRRWICAYATFALFSATWLAMAAPANQTYLVDTNGMPVLSGQYISPTNDLGSWIWTDKTFDQQTCQLWKAFMIPDSSPIVKARLVVTADNEFTLFLDGRELGQGAEWRELFVFDLSRILKPGQHVLAVRAFNSTEAAGLILGLRVDLADDRIVEVKSDSTWRIVPNNGNRWEKMTRADDTWPAATVIAPLAGRPWWTKPVGVNIMPTPQQIKMYFWQAGWFQIMLLIALSAAVLISFRHMAQLALHQKEKRLLQQERTRIAREIHDDIGSRMTQLVLYGEEAQNGIPVGSETRLQLVQICEEARRLLSTMDEILWAVNPRRDTLRDFTAYVCKYAQASLKHTQIQCLFDVDTEMSAVDFNLPLRRSLLMAIKETLNNAVKHSEATELRLQIKWQRPGLVVVVQDNGKGFDPMKIGSERDGIINIKQRMKELEGNCQIVSQVGKGCRVEFNIPLRRQRQNLWTSIWNTIRFSQLTHKPKKD